MTLRLRYVKQVVIFDIRGKITVGKGDAALRWVLRELLSNGRRHILLNLENTTYVDSCGLSEIVACYRRARERNGMIKLLSPPGRVRDLLRVTRLDQVLETYAAEDAALASFYCNSSGYEGRAMLLSAIPTLSLT